jgi:polyisoprenyl-phosphate glycosyltransferase
MKIPVPTLTIVVPCYNEEAVLPETQARLLEVLDKLEEKHAISTQSKLVFVDDGSKDGTWRTIENLAEAEPRITGLKLSRNRGHQNAVLAGLLKSSGDILITIDADLQDDLDAIEQMISAHATGADIVYGVRKARDTDTWFKRTSAEAYYKLLAIFGVEIVFNHADYRLMSRRAIEALRAYGEVNLFLRGIVPQLGYPTAVVYYDRSERFAGESKYPLSKMLALAWQGITSFSTTPLRIITTLGFLISGGSFAFTMWAILIRAFTEQAIPGWASTVVPIYLLGGIQLLCIGIIGEYLGKIYTETKNRPRYFIEQDTSSDVFALGKKAHKNVLEEIHNTTTAFVKTGQPPEMERTPLRLDAT